MLRDPSHANVVRTVASLAIAGALAWGLVTLFQPFLIPVAIGGIVALLSSRVYEKLQPLIRWPMLRAAITVLGFAFVVSIPLMILASILLREAAALNATLRTPSYSFDSVGRSLDHIISQLGIQTPHLDLRTYVNEAISFVASRSTGLVTGAFGILGSTFMTLISAFYILQSQDAIKDTVLSYSPLTREDTGTILQRTREVIEATVIGNLTLIVIQAAAATLGFFLFGVGSPLLLGVVYGIASLVPTIGTTLVWLPVGIFLLMQGDVVGGLGIMLWSLVLVGTLDNLVGPRLIERRARLHPFLVLLGVLGGVAEFGALGVVLGPTVVALGIVGLEMLARAWES